MNWMILYLSSSIFFINCFPPDSNLVKYTPLENFTAFQLTVCLPALSVPFNKVTTFCPSTLYISSFTFVSTGN